jgi:hypothetical protein
MSVLGVVWLILVILKACGLISLSWLVVLLWPLAPLVLILILFLISLVILALMR